MKKILLIIVSLVSFVSTMNAAIVSVNYDTKTIAAMAAAFGTETASEAYYNEQVKQILSKYSAAEVAAAGIFASKYLDRKALTDVSIWSNSTENYYYKRIYKLVSAKIMPKIWTVAGLMLHSPQTALYWGSYLAKVCTETKSLCMQFEAVVTNSKIGFSDITFLELSPEVAKILDLTKSDNVDWQNFLDGLGNISHNFTKESLTADVDRLYNLGVGLANAGGENLMQHVLSNSNFNGTFVDKANSVAQVVDNSYAIYQSLDKSVGNTLLSLLGGKTNVSKLFNISNYNITSWLTDYVRETIGQYYTQRWYIYRSDSGSEVVCDYVPPTDDKSIVSGDEWTRFDTNVSTFSPSSTQLDQVKSNSESYAGWSSSKVSQLNSDNYNTSYNINYVLYSKPITKKGQVIQKAFAYAIKVTKTWRNTEEVYDDVFDSYSMDINTFQTQFDALLAEYNDNDEGYTYAIGAEDKHYYNATNAEKMKGCESVILSVTCNDGTTINEGNAQYKCKHCSGILDAHTKECSMTTTLSDNSLDLTELEQMEKEYEQEIATLQQQINSTPATEKSELATLKSQLAEAQQNLSEVQQAKQDASSDNDVTTDDYYRIPAIMADCKNAYSLTWKDAGSWSGYTFIREATAPNISGTITFTATISVSRKPQYFLGIRIHRAIINISWKLYAEYSDSQVVDVLTFDNSTSVEDKAKQVNNRISEIAQDYPSCQVNTEYIKNDADESEATEDSYHLLWSSDRLEVAREIDTRLTQIYADLVSLEKMMNYKLSIVDVLRNITPMVDDTQGKKLTITEAAHKRWLKSAAKPSHSIKYNGKYDDEE